MSRVIANLCQPVMDHDGRRRASTPLGGSDIEPLAGTNR